jgi:NAD(P)-dependent dehydrogenase (short-subunit alcohol dehydrogenase family)
MAAQNGVAVVTGASDGIGKEVARGLVRGGFEVVIVGRSAGKTQAVADELGVESHVADFTDLGQVRRLGEDLALEHPRIAVLANNAGGIAGARAVTPDGLEWSFQVNHLAPFLLTHLLRAPLVAASGTVISTSSSAHMSRMASVDLEDLQSERNYSALRAYASVKLENVLFTRELARRWGPDGVTAVAVHPGPVRSRFGASSVLPVRLFMASPMRLTMLSPAQGADTIVWLAGQSREAVAQGGYYTKRALAEPNPLAQDEELAKSLWERSEVLAGVVTAT